MLLKPPLYAQVSHCVRGTAILFFFTVPLEVSIVQSAFEADVLLITKEEEEDFPKWTIPILQLSSDIDNMGSLMVAVRENSYKCYINMSAQL